MAPSLAALVALAGLSLATLSTTPAHADQGSPPLQAQVGVLTRTPLPVDLFGGVEAHFNATVNGFGLAVGLGAERFVRDDDRVANGGYLLWGVQYRPFERFGLPLHRWVDLHLLTAGRLGAFGTGSGGATFHGALVVGAGLDVRILPTFRHLALTAHYRYETFRRPDDAPRHLLLLGIAFRVAQDPAMSKRPPGARPPRDRPPGDGPPAD